MAAPAHHDADVVMESLRDVVIRLISQVTAPAHNNADTVMEALYNMTNVLINDYLEMAGDNPFAFQPALNQLNLRFNQVEQQLNQFQQQLNQIQQDLNQNVEDQRAFSRHAIQLINRLAPFDGAICYPLGANQDALHGLAHTVEEVTGITGANATTALGLLGVTIPQGATAQQRKLLLHQYLGII